MSTIVKHANKNSKKKFNHETGKIKTVTDLQISYSVCLMYPRDHRNIFNRYGLWREQAYIKELFLRDRLRVQRSAYLFENYMILQENAMLLHFGNLWIICTSNNLLKLEEM
jgi:hypothetical protein